MGSGYSRSTRMMRDLGRAGLPPPGREVVVHLPGAQQDPADTRRRRRRRSEPISGRNDPVVNSLTAEAAAFSRSIDFGVNTISGLCRPDRPCQRSRWK